MKYTILINQQAIANAGFHKKTDLVDWAILEYIQCWQTNPKAHRKDLKVWINYSHLIDQMPLLGINAKGPISKRITKLRNLGLIDTDQDKDDQRIYIQTTDLYNNIVIFQTVSQEKHPLPDGNTPVSQGEQAVSQEKHPVSQGEHSYNNQIQQSEIQQSEIKESADAQPPKQAKQKAEKKQKTAFVIPESINKAAWDEFEQHRREIKKPLSDLARLKACNQIKEFTFEDQQRIIDYSISGHYQALYPNCIKVRTQYQQSIQSPKQPVDRPKYEYTPSQEKLDKMRTIDGEVLK